MKANFPVMSSFGGENNNNAGMSSIGELLLEQSLGESRNKPGEYSNDKFKV